MRGGHPSGWPAQGRSSSERPFFYLGGSLLRRYRRGYPLQRWFGLRGTLLLRVVRTQPCGRPAPRGSGKAASPKGLGSYEVKIVWRALVWKKNLPSAGTEVESPKKRPSLEGLQALIKGGVIDYSEPGLSAASDRRVIRPRQKTARIEIPQRNQPNRGRSRHSLPISASQVPTGYAALSPAPESLPIGAAWATARRAIGTRGLEQKT